MALFSSDIASRDKLYVVGFLVGSALLLVAGHNLLPNARILVDWGLSFGGTTAAAILGVLLYRLQVQLKASRHELARKEVELRIAHEVQQALFPRQLPSGRGLEFAAICIPFSGISGDYYDVLELPDGRLIFAIADISGKGISAALLMANLQALLRVMAKSAPDPGEVCRRLNEHLHQVTDASKFATLFYAEWTPAEKRLRYVNAGHNAPVLLKNGHGQRLDLGGMPLGMFPAAEFGTGVVCLEPGDTLVLYSDGITEAVSKNGEEFGDARLEAVVKAHCGKPLTEIQEQILAGVRQWSAQAQEDDMTLVIARATHERAVTPADR
jgi:sigma-B regulation protein RsbU (phosphoserine phosphatase)